MRRRRASRLVAYLKRLKETNQKYQQRSVKHLMARLGMTEEQVFQAALDREKQVMRRVRSGGEDDPLARDILFEYDPDSARNQETYH